MHWKKYENEAGRLSDMGITACWLPRESWRIPPNSILSYLEITLS